MAVYTRIERHEIAAFLGRYAAGELRDFAGTPAGIENTNYFVTTDRGEFVLTILERLSAAEDRFFLDLMIHLAARGIPCPTPLRDAAGADLGALRGKPALLVPRLPGESLVHPLPPHCTQMGGLLARLHLAARDFPARRENDHGLSWWRETAQALAGRLGADDEALLRDELRFQSLYHFADLPRGVIHGDPLVNNVLFQDERISGVIDFYYACTDAWLLDVAIAVNDWCRAPDGSLDPARTGALLGAYALARSFAAIERGAWPVLLRAAALRSWLARLHHRHFPRAGERLAAQDPDEFRRILIKCRESEYDIRALWPSASTTTIHDPQSPLQLPEP